MARCSAVEAASARRCLISAVRVPSSSRSWEDTTSTSIVAEAASTPPDAQDVKESPPNTWACSTPTASASSPVPQAGQTGAPKLVRPQLGHTLMRRFNSCQATTPAPARNSGNSSRVRVMPPSTSNSTRPAGEGASSNSPSRPIHTHGNDLGMIPGRRKGLAVSSLELHTVPSWPGRAGAAGIDMIGSLGVAALGTWAGCFRAARGWGGG